MVVLVPLGHLDRLWERVGVRVTVVVRVRMGLLDTVEVRLPPPPPPPPPPLLVRLPLPLLVAEGQAERVVFPLMEPLALKVELRERRLVLEGEGVRVTRPGVLVSVPPPPNLPPRL